MSAPTLPTPAGFVRSGERRCPKKGEWFLSEHGTRRGKATIAHFTFVKDRKDILIKVPEGALDTCKYAQTSPTITAGRRVFAESRITVGIGKYTVELSREEAEKLSDDLSRVLS